MDKQKYFQDRFKEALELKVLELNLMSKIRKSVNYRRKPVINNLNIINKLKEIRIKQELITLEIVKNCEDLNK